MVHTYLLTVSLILILIFAFAKILRSSYSVEGLPLCCVSLQSACKFLYSLITDLTTNVI